MTCSLTRTTKHLVLECDKTALLREGLFKCIKAKEENVMRLKEQEKLQYILNMESDKADIINVIYTCSFVTKKTADIAEMRVMHDKGLGV